VRRRRFFAVVTGVAAIAVTALVVTRSGNSQTGRDAGRTSSLTGATTGATAHQTVSAQGKAMSSSTTTITSTTTTIASTTTTTTDPGLLPQTNQFPSTSTPEFESEMNALWQGIVAGSVTPALASFFPRTAYVQLKTGIADPSGDWQDRLVADFGLDVDAAHAVLGPDPSAATLQSVSVPQQYGHWIPPGVCENGIGYYEVANSRVIYQLDGQTRSLGIASMISWRGTWYVVHLGAILRGNSGGGIVDDPEVGPGVSSPSSTC
jgi:hypothetical protein